MGLRKVQDHELKCTLTGVICECSKSVISIIVFAPKNLILTDFNSENLRCQTAFV